AELSDPMLKDRIAELKARRDQACLDAARAEDALNRSGPAITPQTLKALARAARKGMRTESGYRRDNLRALAQRVEVDAKEIRIMGPRACSCARSSPRRAQNRQCLECPVLYRSGAPEEIRTPDPQIRSKFLYPAELRARLAHRAGSVPEPSKSGGNGPLAIGFGRHWQGSASACPCHPRA